MSSDLQVTTIPRIQHNPPARHGSTPVIISGDVSVLDGVKLIATSPFKDFKIHEFSLTALNIAATKFDEALTAPLQLNINSNRVETILVLQSFLITLDPSDIHCRFREIIAKQTAQEPFAQKLNFGKLVPQPQWTWGVVCDYQTDLDKLLLPAKLKETIFHWINDTVLSLLLHDRRFVKLYEELLPDALGLEPDLIQIALRSRLKPVAALLDYFEYDLVLKNEEHFRQVSRENPQLLPYLMAYCLAHYTKILPEADPVKLMKNDFLKQGLSAASWRYLTHYGSNIFKPVWTAKGIRVEDAKYFGHHYLRGLERSGLPPPPPPSLATLWINGYSTHDNERLIITHRFTQKIDQRVMRTCLLEADRRRYSPDFNSFKNEFMGVCRWGQSAEAKKIDKNQAKAGWKWMVKQYRQAEKERLIKETKVNPTWKTTLQEFTIDQWHIVPIKNKVGVILEGIVMRNCLDENIASYIRSGKELYSVRHHLTGKHLALFCFDNTAKGIVKVEARGFANTPLSEELMLLYDSLHLLLVKIKTAPKQVIELAIDEVFKLHEIG